jgi:hypothetical protein
VDDVMSSFLLIVFVCVPGVMCLPKHEPAVAARQYPSKVMQTNKPNSGLNLVLKKELIKAD